jgi:aspartyl-tRNA synthetase
MISEYKRSHALGVLSKKDIDQFVRLSGWVHRRRDHGGLIFIDLRDKTGITQLVINPEQIPIGHQLRQEWVITIQGVVVARRDGKVNIKITTGEIEVLVRELCILSKAKPLPFSVSEDEIGTHEETRLHYRYLDIRRGHVMANLIKRHDAMQLTRNYLSSHGFIEITTPILGKSTPEGARDFLVPSRTFPGNFYALPQSPQLFKQLFMISGIDRYFQIATCFRDEDLRADRQPEFTQIDIEMSFDTPEGLMTLMEGFIADLLSKVGHINVSLPIRKMTHQDVIEKYGTDKPDLRFGMEFITLTQLMSLSSFSVFLEVLEAGGMIKGIVVKEGEDISRKEIDEYTSFVSRFGVKGLAWMKMQGGKLTSNIVKFFSAELQDKIISYTGMENGDLLFMIGEEQDLLHKALDHLRRKIAVDRNLIHPYRHELLWVTDFPLFEWRPEEKKLSSIHHPFTSPLFSDLHLLDTDPLKVRSSGYDLVWNGYEVGGGSQRIHDMELQKKIFSLLGISPEEQQERFGFFLDALSYGTPPHLGIAFGLDRLMMLLCKTDNIREVIAFPKTQKGQDLMLKCPSQVNPEQLIELDLS